MAISRRDWLVGTSAAALVGGFDPVTRTWLSHAHADARRHGLPALEGELAFDAPALSEAARDFGGIIEQSPWAVLRPASVEDVATIVRFANRHGLTVAMRGQAHSVYGQAQAPHGVVIDSRSLATVHELDTESALVDAGVTWRTLVTTATAASLTPRVLTDYLDLSIGGVLSVGGIGGSTHRFGLVADTCLELLVVTGEGQIVRCSSTRHAQLFEAVLGGLGQCAIIVQARIALAPAQPLARVYQLIYSELEPYLRDQRLLNDEDRFDFLEGLVTPLPSGQFQYVLQAAHWFSPDAPPDDARALAGLSPAASEVQELPYVAWLSRVDATVDGWQASGSWTGPHPWSDLFLPDHAVQQFVADTLASLAPEDVGEGVLLLYPFKRRHLTRPLIRVPSSDTIWLFDILRTARADAAHVEKLLDDNRRLLDRALAVGGKRYPISAVPLRPLDFPLHYGRAWGPLVVSKARWDPRRVLTPGQRIFRS